jgi:diguanylate cyclase (GGDEF)-like protein
MGLYSTAFLRWFLPLALLLGAIWARPYGSLLSPEELTLAGYMPYLLGMLVIALAYQFNRSRFVLLALVSLGCFWLIQSRLQVSLAEAGTKEIYLELASGAPLLFLFLLLVPERGVLNRFGAVYTLALLCLALLAPALVEGWSRLLVNHPEWLSTWPAENFVLPLAQSALFALVGIVGGGVLLWRGDDAEAALLATLAALFIVLGRLHEPYISLALFNGVGLVQLLGILRSSHAMAYRDDLTGLLGRRALNERLAGLGTRYCVAMMDVDHFKKFNDKHGHDVGDDVLKLVATRIARVGGGGTAFRYGGEEFCVVFPRRDIDECYEAIEVVRESIAGYQMTLRDAGQRPQRVQDGAPKRGKMATKVMPGTVSVTISVGLAERNEDTTTPEAVLKVADQQLYRAKQAGRNRSCY